MRAFVILGYLVLVTGLPWVAWYVLRHLWMRRRERQILEKKYGDLEMFAERLKEWKVMR